MPRSASNHHSPDDGPRPSRRRRARQRENARSGSSESVHKLEAGGAVSVRLDKIDATLARLVDMLAVPPDGMASYGVAPCLMWCAWMPVQGMQPAHRPPLVPQSGSDRVLSRGGFSHDEAVHTPLPHCTEYKTTGPAEFFIGDDEVAHTRCLQPHISDTTTAVPEDDRDDISVAPTEPFESDDVQVPIASITSAGEGGMNDEQFKDDYFEIVEDTVSVL